MRASVAWTLALFLSLAPAHAAPPSIPPADAPSLAPLGKHAVGTSTIHVPAAGPGGNRRLRVVLWYPAVSRSGTSPSVYRSRLQAPPPLQPLDVTVEALARKGAPPASGRFPLVLVSHGYRGWPESMSYLTENLASKGYVVAGIDHGDLPFTDAAGFQRSFALTASTRARDQQKVLADLTQLARRNADPAVRIIDTGRVGIIGYSMGGFGALATVGAGYDPESPAYRSLPAGALADQIGEARNADPSIRAIVAIAPWGAQPPHRAWSAEGLKRLTMPVLLIAGEEDDISGYREGIRWLFDNAVRSDRRLLVYRNARHNVGGNPSPKEAQISFAYRELFDEPVWRHDRLNAINQHFVTAFLDRHLKGDLSRDAFLRPPAGPSGDLPGFQPRWSVGLDLHAATAGR